jgi:hypothetical protein
VRWTVGADCAIVNTPSDKSVDQVPSVRLIATLSLQFVEETLGTVQDFDIEAEKPEETEKAYVQVVPPSVE